jgi:hypothetical protein
MEGGRVERFAVYIPSEGDLSFFTIQFDVTRLETLIERTLSKRGLWKLIGNLLPVGVKVPIRGGEKVDVLALDAYRNCVGVLFDFNPASSIVLTVGRAILVASWLEGLSYADVRRIARDWWADESADLESVFQQAFGETAVEQATTEPQGRAAVGFNERPRVAIVTVQKEGLAELQRYLLRQGISVEIAQVEAFTSPSGNAIIFVEPISSTTIQPKQPSQPRREILGMTHSFLSSIVEREE